MPACIFFNYEISGGGQEKLRSIITIHYAILYNTINMYYTLTLSHYSNEMLNNNATNIQLTELLLQQTIRSIFQITLE